MRLKAPRIARAEWSSEKAFVLATAAAAVGLGNIWRFPYLAGENGGAAFIIAYIIAVVVLGLPLMMIEISAGRLEKGGVVKSFRAIHKKAAWFGWLVVLLTFTIMTYYLVVTGWTLGYAVDSLDGRLQSFDQFTSGLLPVLYFFIAATITAIVVFKGVKLIENITRRLMPLLILVILLLTGYSLTTSGAGQALEFLFSPDFSAFGSPGIWAVAFGQAFYSLAIGQGYLITYGSFLPKKFNLPRATGTVAGIETGIALIAGLMIFPIVFTFGLDPATGSDLAFSTLPTAFGQIPIGWLLAAAFFWLFFLAAISSCIAGMEVLKRAAEEELRLRPLWATLAVYVPLLFFGLFSAVSFTPLEIEMFGRPLLSVIDLFTANQVVVVSGLAGAAIIGWILPKNQFINLFGDKYRKLASWIIKIARYGWIIVAAALLAGFVV